MRIRSVAPMRTAKIGYIVISIALCVLGIILIAEPEISIDVFGIVFGIILTLFGCVRLVGYFSKDLYRLAFQYDLTFGILLISVGILILAHPASIMNIICIALGIIILSDGLFKIQISIESKRFGIEKWWITLSLSLVSGICGLILMFFPRESGNMLTIFLGVTLLADGILNLNSVITSVKIVKNQKPDVIEIDYYKERKE